jgi:hypothetical protein
MTITNTPRFELTQWSSGDDEFSREQLTLDNATLGLDAAIFVSGTSATPPTAAASNTRAFYWDKTNSKLYFRGDVAGVDAAAWTQVHPVLPDAHVHSNLQPLDADLTALAAVSTTGLITRTAGNTFTTRQIVVSGTGLAITHGDGVDGNMTISINATSAATISTVVSRDASGNFRAASPADNADVAIKSYVDTADALKANTADVYAKTDIHNAKLYQYGNIAAGGTDTSGAKLPTSGTRTTPRIYVQSNDPSAATGYVGVTGDIWFQI